MPDSPIPGAMLACLDLQAPFLAAISDGAALRRRCSFAFAAATELGIPALLTEQVPEKLGPTVPEVLEAAGNAPVFAKQTFSALADEAVSSHIEKHGVEHLLICGLETPICVYQTALDALNRDLAVTVLSDAVGARRPTDAADALIALRTLGVHVLPSETVFYALLHDVSHPAFKIITQLVKSHG